MLPFAKFAIPLVAGIAATISVLDYKRMPSALATVEIVAEAVEFETAQYYRLPNIAAKGVRLSAVCIDGKTVTRGQVIGEDGFPLTFQPDVELDPGTTFSLEAVGHLLEMGFASTDRPSCANAEPKFSLITSASHVNGGKDTQSRFLRQPLAMTPESAIQFSEPRGAAPCYGRIDLPTTDLHMPRSTADCLRFESVRISALRFVRPSARSRVGDQPADEILDDRSSMLKGTVTFPRYNKTVNIGRASLTEFTVIDGVLQDLAVEDGVFRLTATLDLGGFVRTTAAMGDQTSSLVFSMNEMPTVWQNLSTNEVLRVVTVLILAAFSGLTVVFSRPRRRSRAG